MYVDMCMPLNATSSFEPDLPTQKSDVIYVSMNAPKFKGKAWFKAQMTHLISSQLSLSLSFFKKTFYLNLFLKP